MRSLLLLCALTVALVLVCKPTKQHDVLVESAALSAPVRAETVVVPELATPAPKPSLLALLTLGAAVLGVVSTTAADSPFDANAQLAVRIVDTTAELEASAARIADARAR